MLDLRLGDCLEVLQGGVHQDATNRSGWAGLVAGDHHR